MTTSLRITLDAALPKFIGRTQMACIRDGLRGEEGEAFAEILTRISCLIGTMAKTYEQDGVKDPTVYLHYFTGSADWYITERDMGHNGDESQHQAFGYAKFYGERGEMGYISIAELIAHGAELDLHFTPTTLSAVRAAR